MKFLLDKYPDEIRAIADELHEHEREQVLTLPEIE